MASPAMMWAIAAVAILFQFYFEFRLVTGQRVVIQEVWLVGGNATAGRVEVQVNGTNGTVCDDSWDDQDAKVVCRTRGLTGGVALKGAAYGQGTGPIWMDDVNCAGDEIHLRDCSFVTGSAVNCIHAEDAAVICQPQGAAPATAAPTTPKPGITQPGACAGPNNSRVRLFGIVNGTGYVQVRADNGTYGYLCDDGWDDNAAKVACQELCLNSSYAQSSLPDSNKPVINTTGIVFAMDDVSCTGFESSLVNCSHRPWFEHNCIASEVAALTCVLLPYPVPPPPQPELQCRKGDLIALFSKSRDPNLEPKHLSIYNSICTEFKAEDDGNFIVATIPFSGCNTTVRQNATHIVYSSTLFMQSTSRDGDITRSNEYIIQLTCEMPRNNSVNNIFQPMTETVTQKTVGIFNLTLTIYQDQFFLSPATTAPYRLTLGDWLNAAVELESIDPRLLLVVNNCRAKASGTSGTVVLPNPKDLFVNKCVADRDKTTVELQSINKVKFGLRLQSFIFVNFPNVVLECDNIVCLSSEVTAECDRTCNNTKPVAPAIGRRRRRDTNEEKAVYTVSSLPVYIDPGPVAGISTSTESSLAISSVSAVTLTTTAVASETTASTSTTTTTSARSQLGSNTTVFTSPSLSSVTPYRASVTVIEVPHSSIATTTATTTALAQPPAKETAATAKPPVPATPALPFTSAPKPSLPWGPQELQGPKASSYGLPRAALSNAALLMPLVVTLLTIVSRW